MTRPELLAPAGGPAQLRAAVRFGADAVYLGLRDYGMRARAANFDREAFAEAAAYCRARGVKVYVTLNIFPRDEDLRAMTEEALFALSHGADALIMADPGATSLVREAAPDCEIHLSTQAGTLNAETARFWHEKAGVKRIVLARELTLAQIRAMRAALPDSLELEAFVHGAVCMAYSGRCQLSAYMTGREANRGDCAQPCRWRYRVEEERRPGQYFPVEQTEGGVTLFSAGDLNMLRHLPALCGAGLSALKIEGRMKNELYVATVVGAYRRALDAIEEGAFDEAAADRLGAELETFSHRDYDTGFYFGPPTQPGGHDGLSQTREFAAVVEDCSGGRARARLKCAIETGETLELLTPRGVFPFAAEGLRRDTGEAVSRCAVPGEVITLSVPFPCEAGDLIRCENKNHRK